LLLSSRLTAPHKEALLDDLAVLDRIKADFIEVHAFLALRRDFHPDVGATFDDSLDGIVRVSVVATGIDNTSVTRQPQAGEAPLTNLAEELRNDNRHIADRSQQDVPPMPITPSLLGSAQAEPSMTSTAAPERLRTPRIPRIDEVTQNEIRAALSARHAMKVTLRR
jgi:hypothetical protein